MRPPATFQSLNYVTRTALGTSVSGAVFAVNWMSSTTQRPALEFSLLTNRSPQQAATQYDIAVLRAPMQQPS